MLIIIYVGAIAVLFLFVIMMLDIKIIKVNQDFFKFLPFLFLFFIGSFCLINQNNFSNFNYEIDYNF
jgi:NADH:ubiquinone oxidoreductase subunit 6 (subunit J)